MQFFRAGGSRACSKRPGLVGVVCGNGTSELHDNGTTTSPIEFVSQWKSFDGQNMTYSCKAVASSPLQFIFDDLAASPSSRHPRAFRRAVCVPFQPAAATCSGGAALERKVRRLLLGNRTTNLQEMAGLLMQEGLHAALVHPGKAERTSIAIFARSIGVPFLVVTADDTDEMVVVDGALREHLLVAPCTLDYQRTLAATIPDLFIGTLDRLQQLVTSMASAISLNFTSQGVDVPPWRRTAALLARWTIVRKRLAETEALRREQQHRQRLTQQLQPQPHQSAHDGAHTPSAAKSHKAGSASEMEVVLERMVAEAGDASLVVTRGGPEEKRPRPILAAPSAGGVSPEGGQAGSESQVHGGAAAADQHRPFVVVKGFEVGAGDAPTRPARERETWPCVKPGGLAGLCRKQSGSGTTTSSSAESDGVWGASPSSVLRGE